MKTIAVVIVLAITTVIAPLSTRAQVSPQSTAQTPAQAKPDPIQEAKLQALQSEVQIMKDFTQHILTTVYFSLGTVVIVLIAMVGFGWYQNFRVYERDKEALRQTLSNALSEQLSQKVLELDKKASERFLVFDEKMASALEHMLQRLTDLHLALEASIFHATHSEKTPRTDFMVYSNHVYRGIGKVSPGVLDHALSVMLDYVETAPRIDSPTRTSLLALANQLPTEGGGYAERLRDVLAKKPQ